MPWFLVSLVVFAAIVFAVPRTSNGWLHTALAIAATVGGVVGLISWPFLSAWTINPGAADLIRLCGDAVGREHITDLKVRIGTLPPAILCFPDGWQSEPINASPTQTAIPIAIFFGLIVSILAGLTYLIRRIAKRTRIMPAP